ncbi:DEAD-box ATP-dependent RNA helicase 42 [Quillaja saponaria]|uniref:DEAD-box ATP-dependent RNA helicase 42 n=1 Tax=Quillaja saponaria TaxID=32244 RepID=A0AAD7LGZ2_QUISA|nr:DEAD-box ATP-dependent RNA helicase 42 [Quillaja saponaria]
MGLRIRRIMNPPFLISKCLQFVDSKNSEDEDSGIRKANADISEHATNAQLAAFAAASKVAPVVLPTSIPTAQMNPYGGLSASLPAVLGLPIQGTASVVPGTRLPLLPMMEQLWLHYKLP